jgi:glycosyltransferase involved in cell wall biosynthesis
MKILILWASLSDYMVASFKQLSKQEGVSIFLVYQPANSNAPFKPFDLSFCSGYYEDKTHDYKELKVQAANFDHDIIFMASWNYKHFMKFAKQSKKQGKPVISSFDNQWLGTFKQYMGILSSSLFLKPAITNFLVPGDRQVNFAKKLGYNEPMQGFYCANTNNFKGKKTSLSEKRFVFIGRFVENKSIKELVDAYQSYRKTVKDPWELRMIGEGPLKVHCENIEGIEIEPFAQPAELPSRMLDCSCFILPSKYENWGLVIHEAALVGLPLICSRQCGATTWFLREGQNGYLTNPNSISITKAMINIHNTKKEKLKQMSETSSVLAQLWTIEKWADHINSSFSSYI